jgi:hypothetical protein
MAQPGPRLASAEVLTTNQRGAIAEAEIVSAALKLGVGVFSAVHDERYDLVFDLRPTLLRVQCKTAVVVRDVVVIRCYSSRRSAGGLLKRVYTQKGDRCDRRIQCGDRSRVPHSRQAYRRPLAYPASAPPAPEQPDDRSQLGGRVRLRGYTRAAPGAIAQLGERRLGMAEVAGSSPAGSIRLPLVRSAWGPASRPLRKER